MIRLTPSSTLFPYTTLFRSRWRRSHAPPPRRRKPRRSDDPPRRGERHRTRNRSRRPPPVHGGRRRVTVPTRFRPGGGDRKSTRLNSSHSQISYAVFCLKKKI